MRLPTASGCGDDDDDDGTGGTGGTGGTAGTAGSAGSAGSAGTAGTAGTAGSAGAGAEAMVVPCAGQTIAQTVNMTDALVFAPAYPSVSVGDVIEFANTSTAVQHTSTSGQGGATPSADGKWDTGLVNAGESACVQFLMAGSYPYYCTVHPTTMTGTVTVQ